MSGSSSRSATCSTSSSTATSTPIFSNATFHWILDHDRLFARLFAALRPGGALEAQCGGQDNVAEFVAIESAEGDERFSQYLRGIPSTGFASVGDTQARLARAGFDAKPVASSTTAPTRRRSRRRSCASGLAQQLERLPEQLHDEFVDAVLGSMPRPLVLDYVRLNISARKARVGGAPDRHASRRRDRPRDRRRGGSGARRAGRLRDRRAARRRRLRSMPTGSPSPTRCSTPVAMPTQCC